MSVSTQVLTQSNMSVLNNSEYGKVDFDTKFKYKDIQMYDQNPNITFSLRCNNRDKKYISIGHNLKYNKELCNVVEKIEKIDLKLILCNYVSKFNDYNVKNIYNLSKNGDKYLNCI